MAVTQTINVKVNGAKATGELNKVGKSAKKAAKSTKDIGTEAKASGIATTQMGGAGAAAMAKLRGAVLVAKTSFSTLRGAIIATGIGALLIAVVALVQNFKRTEKGAQQLRVAMAAVGSVVQNTLDVISGLGRALVKLFKGDIKGAGKEASAAFKDLGKNIVDDFKSAVELENAMNRIKVANRELIVDRARANKEIAKARLLAEDDLLSQEVRIDALKRAGKLEEEIATKELNTAKETLRVMEEQNKLSDTSEADLDAVANARAKVLDLETATLSRQKRLATAVILLETEAAAAKKAESDAEAARIKAIEAAKIKASKEEEKRLKKIADIKKRDAIIEENTRKRLDREAAAAAEKQIALDKAVQDAKFAMAQSAITAISGLITAASGASEKSAKRSFKINKALSLASAVVATSQAVTAALTAGGNPLKLATGAQFIDAAVAATAGLAQVLTIKKTKFGTGGGTIPSVPKLSAPSQPASFNIVGQGSLNQLSQSIGQRFNQPLRAYVVGSDVNSEAELNRKRIKTATL